MTEKKTLSLLTVRIKGRVTTEELKRMGEAGIKGAEAGKALADALGSTQTCSICGIDYQAPQGGCQPCPNCFHTESCG